MDVGQHDFWRSDGLQHMVGRARAKGNEAGVGHQRHAQRVCDGNTADSATHIESWDGLRALVGRPDFLYVADCKLATSEQMDHINANGGRPLEAMPALDTIS